MKGRGSQMLPPAKNHNEGILQNGYGSGFSQPPSPVPLICHCVLLRCLEHIPFNRNISLCCICQEGNTAFKLKFSEMDDSVYCFNAYFISWSRRPEICLYFRKQHEVHLFRSYFPTLTQRFMEW